MTRLLILVLALFLIQLSGISGQSEFRDSPASTTVLTNFPASLSCTSLPPPAFILWEKDGFTLTPDERLEISLNPSTGRSDLRLATVYYGDAGEYLCRAFDAGGTILGSSQSATVIVQGFPVLSVPPVTAAVGSSATLDCQVLSNPEATSTMWFYERGGLRQNITTGGRFIVSASMLTIVNIQESDAGHYICSAQNIFGTNSTSGRLTVRAPSPPLVVTISPNDPDPFTLPEGTTTTFSCSVPSGTSISTIAWSQGSGEEVTGVARITNGLLLTVTADTKASDVLYTCTVVDAAGSNSSQSIRVVVTVPPTFSIEPADVTGTVGTLIAETVSCSAEGDPTPTITWLRPDLTPRPAGPVTNTPQFGVLTMEDAGTYTCLAANSAGEIRSQFTVTVQAPPLVRIIPPSVSVPPGEDVTLQCTEEATPPSFSIIWFRVDGSPLPANSVTTGGTLHLFSISSSAAGAYQCMVSNIIGTVNAQAQVTVLTNPSITSMSASPVVIMAQSPLTLTCRGSPSDATLSWYFNGTRQDPASDSNVMIGLDGTLTVANPTISYTGTYTCNVSTGFAAALAHIQVIVGESPAFLATPTDMDLLPGATAFLDCRASGFPSPHSTWFRTDLVSGQRVELGIVGPTHTQLSSGLQLQGVSGNDSGTYECEVENALGMTMQRTTIRVEGSPVAVSIQPTVFPTNTTTTLTCTVPLNFPPGNVSWTTLAGAALPSDRFTVGQSGELTISPVQVEDARGIMCTVSNQYGVSSVSDTIQVLFPPIVTVTPPISDIILESMLVLSCDVQGAPQPEFEWISPPGASAMVDSSTRQLTIPNASPEHIGTYTCMATNPLGSGSDSASVNIRGEGVAGLFATVMGTTSILLQWNDLSPEAQIVLQSYQLIVRRAGREDILVDRSIPFFSRTFTVSNLLPGVMYEFTFRGVYVDNVLGVDSIVIATTQEEAPSGPPLNLEATGIENGAYLEWLLPDEDLRNGVITSHTVEYRLTPDPSNPDEPYLSLSVPTQNQSDAASITYPLRNLQGGRSYDIRVIALTAVGEGPPSDPVVVTTAPGRLIGPVSVSITIGVGVVLVGVALVAVVVLGVYVICLIHRRRTRVGKHEPLVAEEKGKKKDAKKMIVSGPIPGIKPKIDDSAQGKFTVQGQNGKVLNLKPKVITAEDVAPAPSRGGSVKVVGREETVLARSNDESDEGRIDPYDSPVDAIKNSGVQRQQKSSTPIKVRGRVESGVYSEVSDVMKTPPREEKEEEEREGGEMGGGDSEDRPYEEVQHGKSGEVWGRGAEEESDGGSQQFLHEATPPLEHPEAPDLGQDDSNLLYSSVSQKHVEMKREKRLQEEQRRREEESKKQQQRRREEESKQQQQQAVSKPQESKQEKKMREKLERERLKQEERERKKREKEAEKERKRQEAERKKREKENKKRESMGLSNIVSYQDIDFSKPGARAQADFIDSATAAMF